jgi:hypothetical protein
MLRSWRALCSGLVMTGAMAAAASQGLAQLTDPPAAEPAAKPAGDGPVLTEFPPDKEVCYGRVYPHAHLAAHPGQKVTEIYLTRLLSHDSQSEEEFETREQIAAQNRDKEPASRRAFPEIRQAASSGAANLQVYVRFSDKPGMFRGDVECSAMEGGFRCYIPCDGGGFSAKPKGKGLLMEQSHGLRVQSGCGGGDDESAPAVTISADGAEGGFHLEPAPIESCERARAAYRPHWTALGRPLRKRFVNNPKLCFRRIYGEEHLKAHPEQLVKAVTLQTIALSNSDKARDPEGRRFHAQLLLRGGTVVDTLVHCAPSSYVYRCKADKGSFRLVRGSGKSVTLRESYYEEGSIAELLGVAKVQDDHIFRLDEVDPEECR